MTEQNVMYTNAITDKKLKEHVADQALALLLNNGLMTPGEMPRVKIEFGYLLVSNSGDVCTLFKVIISRKIVLLMPRTYYFGSSNGNLSLLDSSFTEITFDQVTLDMTKMHPGIDFTANRNSYYMEMRQN